MEDTEIAGLYWARDQRAVHETAAKYGRFLKKLSANILSDDLDAEAAIDELAEILPARKEIRR